MILMLRGGVRGMERSMHDFVYANKGHRIINLILDLTSSLKKLSYSPDLQCLHDQSQGKHILNVCFLFMWEGLGISEFEGVV